MRNKIFSIMLLTLGLLIAFPFSAGSQPGNEIALVQAVLCEDIKAHVPQNLTSVFSIERRTAICFTAFDPVPKKAVIYHHWYHRDTPTPSARIKLTLKPPRWASYSSIQLRAEDIGPWRVEITDAQGNIFHVLRFSVTE